MSHWLTACLLHSSGIFQVIPEKVKALVESCWRSDYEARPELDEVIERMETLSAKMKPRITEAAAAPGPCCSLM